jgi:hypothetical protein
MFEKIKIKNLVVMTIVALKRRQNVLSFLFKKSALKIMAR